MGTIYSGLYHKVTIGKGYDSILVVCNWLTKMVHFIPIIEKILAEELTVLFWDHVLWLRAPNQI